MKPTRNSFRAVDPRAGRRRTTVRGFTLIELMAAMAVFSILLVMLLRVFNGTARSFNTATGFSKQTTEARLVMDYLAQQIQENSFDLKQAAGDSEILLKDEDCLNNTDSIRVSTFTTPANEKKLIQQDLNAGVEVPMLDHVIDFEVSVFYGQNMPNGVAPSITGIDTHMHGAGCTNSPILAVIYLETLADHHARINANPGVAATYAENHSQRYYRTVYLRDYLANK